MGGPQEVSPGFERGDGERVPISVIVPAYNAASTLDECLRALLNQSLPRASYELIVVDDASSDSTVEIAERYADQVVRLRRNAGPGGARNAGIHAAQGEILLFTDADCAPISTFLEAMAAPFESPEVGGTKGTYLTRQPELVARFAQIEYEDRYRRTRRERWIDFVDTYAAGFRKADMIRCGGFDTSLRQCQDQELSFRLAEMGVKIRFIPEAQTFHLHASSLGDYLRKKYRIAWWKVAVLRRHPKKAVRDSHTPQTLKLEIAAAYATCLSILAAPVLAAMGFALAWLLPLISAASFFALSLPFALRAWAKDRGVALAAVPILFLRDLALGAGLIMGSLAGTKR